MRLAAFFVYLCAILFGWNAQAFAGAHHTGKSYTAVQQYEKAVLVKIAGAHQNIQFDDNSTGTEINYLFRVDIDDNEDDDDAGSSVAKKCRLPFTHHPASIYLSILNDRRYCFKTITTFQLPASPKYILQRNLRI